MSSSWVTSVAPKPITSVLTRDRRAEDTTRKDRKAHEDGDELERCNHREHQGPPELEGAWRGSLLEPPEEARPG